MGEPQELFIDPGEEAIAAARQAWSWLISEPWTSVACSAMGDIFLQTGNGEIFWLDCGQGSLERIAADADQFQSMLSSDEADEWLLPPLVMTLGSSGKKLGPAECYSFITLPVFAEGSYNPDNIFVCKAAQHYAVTGDIHRKINDIPDGGRVQIAVTQ